MQIDNTLLTKLEKLSHLHIAEEKKEETMGQLTEILKYIDNLNELDTDTLNPSFSTLEGGTPLREDAPRESNDISKEIFTHAPQAEDDLFIVPAIIE